MINLRINRMSHSFCCYRRKGKKGKIYNSSHNVLQPVYFFRMFIPPPYPRMGPTGTKVYLLLTPANKSSTRNEPSPDNNRCRFIDFGQVCNKIKCSCLGQVHWEYRAQGRVKVKRKVKVNIAKLWVGPRPMFSHFESWVISGSPLLFPLFYTLAVDFQ